MDEEKDKPEEKPEDKKPEAAEAGDVKGSEPKTTPFIDEANLAAKRMEESNKEKKELLDREENLQARKEALNALGGGSPAGTKPAKPAKLTDTEYAEALERGEVNPLKEDGFI